jgi:peroxiredoxin
MRNVWAGILIVALGLVVEATGHAQSYSAFEFKSPADFVAPAFRDDEIARWMAAVDRLLAEPTDPADWPRNAGDVLMTFSRRLQVGRLSRAQEARVVARLEAIGASRPDAKAVVAGPLQIIRQFTIGKTAPDIIGTDLDGQPLQLSAFRNKVVLVAFSAEWCAICRAQIPYERFLADRYQRWPFALLGVQTGTNRDTAKRAQDETGISSRAWWDPPAGADAPHGAIAAAWQVSGWPITYVIDGNGVIRFVDVRDEDLLKAVRQLVEAQADRDAKASHQKPR